MKNYFIGFVVSDEVREAVVALSNALPEPWKATAPQDLHMTVHYLGAVADDKLAQLEALGGCIAEDFSPLTLSHGRSIVMRPDKPYMFWVKYALSTWLDDITRDCARRIGRLGTEKDYHSNRRPTPHLTLARLPHGIYADSLVPPLEISDELTNIRFDRLALWSSERGNYTLVRSWDLKG